MRWPFSTPLIPIEALITSLGFVLNLVQNKCWLSNSSIVDNTVGLCARLVPTSPSPLCIMHSYCLKSSRGCTLLTAHKAASLIFYPVSQQYIKIEHFICQEPYISLLERCCCWLPLRQCYIFRVVSTLNSGSFALSLCLSMFYFCEISAFLTHSS